MRFGPVLKVIALWIHSLYTYFERLYFIDHSLSIDL